VNEKMMAATADGINGMKEVRRFYPHLTKGEGQFIALMKKDVILINVARGAVTDEAALASALLEGRLGGLGVDVYSVEPFPADHPFAAIKDHPRVIFTPHMAWGAKEARERCLDEVAQNIKAFLCGERRNRID
jgi:glycerate dehydrogenase